MPIGVAIGSNGLIFAVWAFISWYGSRLVMYYGASGGDVFVVGIAIAIGGLALGSGMSSVKYFSDAMAASVRIREVIKRVPEIDSDNMRGEILQQVSGEVDFKNVNFAYPSKPESIIFKDFYLKVPAGRTVALVGGSGSGKSTVIALLQRFYDPQGGDIFVDGVRIDKLQLKWLRSQMGFMTSMLTVQKLQPKYTDINQILRNGESVGYQDGSFVKDMLKNIGFDDSKVKKYSTFEQYDQALQLGSQNGGVSAIMDELPYFRVFLGKYCSKYTMTGPTYKTVGLGFAFPKGSPLVHDVSRAVLQVTEEQMTNISKQWFGESASCEQQNGATVTSDTLTLESFKGIFLIAGLSSTSALVLFFLTFLYQNREMLVSETSISQKF